MAAPKGNRYGVDSGNFFKPKSYTPEEWKEVFLKYLDHRQNKVWKKNEAIKGGDLAGQIIGVPSNLPLTIESFCIFADVSLQTFYNYEKGEKYKEYFEITARIRQVIESDQLEGSIVGAYNPNIIARKLGLSETTKNENTHKIAPLSFNIIKKEEK